MNASPKPSSRIGMLAKVAERIRSSTSFHAIAHSVVAELERAALVLCDAAGEPTLWIGDVGVARESVHAYLDGGYRDDALFARARETFVPQCDGETWVGPVLGGDGVIGMLRVRGAYDPSALTTIAAYISIRIAILGLALDDARSMSSLTPRQREVAELVAHGCT